MRIRFPRHVGLALLAACITLGLLIAAYGFTPAITRSVGDNDSLVFRDVHNLESTTGFNYHWTGRGPKDAPTPLDGSRGTSSVALPQVGQPPFGVLSIGVWLPDTQPVVPLTISADQEPIVTLPVQGRRIAQILLPRDRLLHGELQFDLTSPTWSPPNDARALGVGIERVSWQQRGWTLPPTRQLWVLPGLACALFLLLTRLGVGNRLAGGCTLLISGGLAIAAAQRPLEVAPYTQRMFLVIMLAHAALLIWTALLRSERRWWQLPHQINATALLLLLGLAYWMLLLFQTALWLENGPNVRPRPGTAIIGGITLAILLVIALVPRLLTDTRWRAALTVLAVGGVAEAIYAATFSFRRSGPDFFILWRGAYDFSLGRPLYRMEDVLTNHFGHVFKVPPFYGMFFLPIANASDAVYNIALTVHRSMNLVLYTVTGALLAWLLKPRVGALVAITGVGIVMGLMQPPFDTIAYGQIDIVLLLMLTLALIGLQSRRNWLIGLTITLGTLFKLYPLVIVGFLFVRREWKAIGWVAAWMIILNGIAIAVMGWPNHVMYITQVVPNIGGGTSWVENQTINGFVARLVRDPLITEPIKGRLINLITYGGFAFVAGASLLLALIPSDRRSSTFALQFSIFTVVMVLAVPAAWMHYSTITILVFLMLVWYTHDRSLSLGRAALLAFAFGLIAYGNQWSFFDGTRNPGLPALAISYKFFGLALLWGVTLHGIWQMRAVREPRAARQPLATAS